MRSRSGVTLVELMVALTLLGVGLLALAAAAQNWALRRNRPVEGALFVFAGLLLVFPSLIEALAEALSGRDIQYTATLGLVIGAGVVLWQVLRPAAPAPATTT